MSVYSFCTGRIALTKILPVFFLASLLASPLSVVAQSASGLLPNQNTVKSQPVNRGQGTVRVFAVMVEFQPDNNRFTTGDGTFNPDFLNNPDIPITIDPLPHDAAYFNAHLAFAASYYDRVSNGKLTLEYEVYPEVIRLDRTMDAYSPLGEDGSQNGKIYDLVEETWAALAQKGGFNASGYDEDRDAFILFHAGAGRDINFLGTSLDRTPQDIPSLYLSREAIQRISDNPSFDGFVVPNTAGGTFRIKNTLVLPETESRPGTDVTETDFVLQLGINGLICATIGNHIGLPDLYNTNDGSSAIGKFGLMDGSGFFSYFGMFPPEPSAWEKVHMGWVDPIVIDPRNAATFDLPAVSLRMPNSIYKIPISSDEYYLIENRHRDPENDGITLTIQTSDGSIVQKTLTVFDDLFGSTSSDSLSKLLPSGVVIDVDNFDWSLPGGVDPGDDERFNTDDDRLLNGGILIWHIDEAVIRANDYASGFNNNFNRRGVDLEEADGSQDIGFQTNNQFLAGFVNGTAFDFWWSGNDARVITSSNREIKLYENRFGVDTRPANISNTGERAAFELFDFSDNLPIAQFSIRPVVFTDIIAETFDVTLPSGLINRSATVDPFPTSLAVHQVGADTMLVIPTRTAIEIIGVGSSNRMDRQTLFGDSPHQPWFDGNSMFATQKAGIAEQRYGTARYAYQNGSYSETWRNENSNASVGFMSQSVNGVLDFDLGTTRLLALDGSSINSYPQPVQWSATVNGTFFEYTAPRLVRSDGVLDVVPPATNPFTGYVAAFLPQAGSGTAALRITQSTWSVVTERSPQLRTILSSHWLGWPAILDWDQDGRTDFIGVNRERNRIEGVNQDGGSLNGFPIQAPNGLNFSGTPLMVDLDGEGAQSLIITAIDSLSIVILAYNENLQPREGFPLTVGSLISDDDIPIHPVFHGSRLFAVSPRGDVKSWRFPAAGSSTWPSPYGQFRNGKVTGFITTNQPSVMDAELLVMSETYNWPNPADDMTHIRFMTTAPARVTIQMISQDGKTVYSDTFQTQGELPVDIPLATDRLGNGVYMARIQATSENRSESKTIKIAVIH